MLLSRPVSFILLAVTALAAAAQAPGWLDEDWRHTRYPADTYFCGFASVSTDIDPKAAAAAHAEAVRLLAEAVFSDVSVNTSSSIGSAQVGDRYEEFDTFRRDMSVNSGVALTGMTVDSYVDPATGTAYEFARVEKDKLRSYYDALVGSALSEADGKLTVAEGMAVTADRSELKAHADAVAALLGTARSHRRMLMALKPEAAAAHEDAVRSADSRLAALEALVSRGIMLYMPDAADAHSKLVADRLKGVLAEHGCTFADSEDAADYVLSLSAATELMSVYDEVYHVNASVQVALTNRRKGVRVYHDEITCKGSGLTEKMAAKKALGSSVGKIEERINQYLK